MSEVFRAFSSIKLHGLKGTSWLNRVKPGERPNTNITNTSSERRTTGNCWMMRSFSAQGLEIASLERADVCTTSTFILRYVATLVKLPLRPTSRREKWKRKGGESAAEDTGAKSQELSDLNPDPLTLQRVRASGRPKLNRRRVPKIIFQKQIVRPL